MSDSALGKPSKKASSLKANLKACRIAGAAPASPEDMPSYSYSGEEAPSKVKKDAITKSGSVRVTRKQGERAAIAKDTAYMGGLSDLLAKENLEPVLDIAEAMNVFHLVRNQINSPWAPKEAFRAKLFTCQVLTLGETVVKVRFGNGTVKNVKTNSLFIRKTA